MTKHPTVAALEKAVTGLTYVSETESELEPFLWDQGELNKKRLLELVNAAKGETVEEESLDDFFRTVSTEDKPKFTKLANAINEQLKEVKVYKIGAEAEKQVYVVGKTADGKLAGVKATVVET